MLKASIQISCLWRDEDVRNTSKTSSINITPHFNPFIPFRVSKVDIMKCRGAQWCIHSYRVLNLRSIGPMQAVLEWLMACVDPEGGRGGQGFWTPHGKSQVAIGFLRTSGTDPPPSRSNSFGFNCFPREVHRALYEIRWLLKKSWQNFLDLRMDGEMHCNNIYQSMRQDLNLHSNYSQFATNCTLQNGI